MDTLSFRLGDFGFANTVVQVHDNVAFFSDRLDLRDEMNLFVDVDAGIDVNTGRAFWIFESIDPESGEAPSDPEAGFLAINDSTHIGEGYVNFEIMPGEDLITGSTVDASASIYFDFNEPVITEPWFNTIDAGSPISEMSPEAQGLGANSYEISWTGADPSGTEIASYDIYLQTNSGDFIPYLFEEQSNSAIVELQPGQVYGFFSIARDFAGNIEPLKSNAELIVNLNAPGVPIIISAPILEIDEDELYEYQIEAIYPEGNPAEDLIFTAVNMPTWLELNEGGLISGTPAQADVGGHIVSVRIENEAGFVVNHYFVVEVNHVNHAPILSGEFQTEAFTE